MSKKQKKAGKSPAKAVKAPVVNDAVAAAKAQQEKVNAELKAAKEAADKQAKEAIAEAEAKRKEAVETAKKAREEAARIAREAKEAVVAQRKAEREAKAKAKQEEIEAKKKAREEAKKKKEEERAAWKAAHPPYKYVPVTKLDGPKFAVAYEYKGAIIMNSKVHSTHESALQTHKAIKRTGVPVFVVQILPTKEEPAK